MAQLEGGATGSNESASSDIKAWMIQNGFNLLDDTYTKLETNGFNTVRHLRACKPNEMADYVKPHTMNIKLVDRSKLIRAIEKLSNKKHFVDPQELNIISSIELKTKQFKNNINNLMTEEKTINQQKEKISIEINDVFKQLISKLTDRKKFLLNELDNITNKKNEFIQNKLNNYNISLQNIEKIKQDIDILVDTPIEKKELKDRTLKIIENGKNITKIINDNNQENKMILNDKLYFSIDSKCALQVITNLGRISEINPPILEKLEYDNDNPNGLIKVFWKLNNMNAELEDEKHNDLSKISIEYCMIDGNDNKNNDIDEKQAISKEIEINNNTFNGNENIRIDMVGTYLFKLRGYENKWSPYSNIKSINVNKIVPLLIWDQTQHGKVVQFIKKDRVKCGSNGTHNTVVCSYSIDSKKCDAFCWEIECHVISANSWIGFVPYPANQSVTNWDTCLYFENNAFNFGFANNCTTATIRAPSLSNHNKTFNLNGKAKNGDKFKFKVDWKNKNVDVYHNDKLLQYNGKPIFENITPTNIIPAVSNNNIVGEYSIKYVNL